MSTKVAPQITSEKLISKDNALIMASYSLSVDEQRLLLAGIEKAQRTGKTNVSGAIEISLTAHEYATLYGVTVKTAYNALSLSSNRLYERSITMTSDEDVKLRRIRWLQEQAIYESGKVTLVFSDIISKHIREIKTIYRLEQATQLRSKHAIRYYEIFQLLVDHKTQEGEWQISVTELKNIFEITDSDYPRWSDFRRRVVVEPIRQINKNTSMNIEFDVVKNGREVVGLVFTLFESKQLRLGLD